MGKSATPMAGLEKRGATGQSPSMNASDAIDLTLPAITFPETAVETAAGRLSVPGWQVAEKTVAIRPSLVAELTGAAREAAARAHAPYSRFRVGAAVVMADDPEAKIFSGCNVENASFGATICAERNAIFAAAAAGFRRIELLAVSTLDSLAGPIEGRSPCGICRQVTREFADEKTLIVIDSGADDALGEVVDIDRLLPWGFVLREESRDG